MNWWERPEWLAFVANVRAKPTCNLTRTVAADWLDEFSNDPSAVNRAALIRSQCAAGPEHDGLKLRRHDFAAAGFPEPEYQNCTGLSIVRGWPNWAVFLPTEFTADRVSPVFMLSVLSTISTAGVCAERDASATYGTTGARTRRIVYRLHIGPEDQYDGTIDAISAASASEARVLMHSHAQQYRMAGLIPAPVYSHLPPERGAGGAVQRPFPENRRSRYDKLQECARATLQAHWLAALAFVRSRYDRDDPAGKRVVCPEPEQAAVTLFTDRTHFVSQESDITAPSSADDPFNPFAGDGFLKCPKCGGSGTVLDALNGRMRPCRSCAEHRPPPG